jgi:uncharacterized protein YcbX
MAIEIGRVEAIFRDPVKSMRGEPLDAAPLGWHGLEGDRRMALRRLGERGGFPWLTASKLPELVHFTPRRRDGEALPGHVLTPEGEELPAFGEALAAEIGRRHGAPVEMMQLNHGIFDDASLSVISAATIGELGRLAGRPLDARRFRPNVVVGSLRGVAFEEDDWVGATLAFGDGADAPAVTVTSRDVRCVMVNLDPDGGAATPEVLKAVGRANDSCAGIYATVTRVGTVAVGQPVVLRR